MKTLITTCLLVFSSFMISAQDSATIHVSGTSQMEVSPDIAVFSYRVTATAKDYEQALREMNARTNSLVDKLKKGGFKSNEIETTSFSINENNVYDRGKVIGKKHTASQSIVVSFDFEESKLLSVLKNTTNSEIEATLSINFRLSDKLKKQTRDKLLKSAVKDAKEKAELLVTEMDYKLSGIKQITYNSNGNTFQPYQNNRMEYKTMAMESAPVQFDPKDFTVSEQVQVIYYIDNE